MDQVAWHLPESYQILLRFFAILEHWAGGMRAGRRGHCFPTETVNDNGQHS